MPHADPIIRAEWQRQYRIRNAERLRAYGVAFRAANRERMLQEKKDYYYRTHEKWCAYNRERYKNNKHKWTAYRIKNRERINALKRKAYNRMTPEQYERFCATCRAWRSRNPETVKRMRKTQKRRLYAKYSAMDIRRKQLKKDATVNVENIQQFYEFVKKQVKIRCYYCRRWVKGEDTHIDHVIPIAKGGKHCVSNLAASCPKCNLRKSTKLPSEFNGLLNL